MSRTLTALILAALVLTGCGSNHASDGPVSVTYRDRDAARSQDVLERSNRAIKRISAFWGNEFGEQVKINIDPSLFERAKRAAQVAGYSSVDEFIAHCVETGIQKHAADEAETQVADQLRGLGYIE